MTIDTQEGLMQKLFPLFCEYTLLTIKSQNLEANNKENDLINQIQQINFMKDDLLDNVDTIIKDFPKPTLKL